MGLQMPVLMKPVKDQTLGTEQDTPSTLKQEAGADFGGGGGAGAFGDDLESKLEGGAGAAAGDEVAVDHNGFIHGLHIRR